CCLGPALVPFASACVHPVPRSCSPRAVGLALGALKRRSAGPAGWKPGPISGTVYVDGALAWGREHVLSGFGASDVIEINGDIGISEHELSFSFDRSPGPGGQNVNKVNTRVTLHFDVH